MTDCTFCDIRDRRAPATIIQEWSDALAFLAAPGVTEAPERHILVIPRRHVRDAAQDPALTGVIAGRAAELAARTGCAFQLSVNNGEAAGQTKFHLHWHCVLRQPSDGLILMPWEAKALVATRTAAPNGARQFPWDEQEDNYRKLVDLGRPETGA